MKRYLVFAYHSYYPEGGWNDFVGSVDELAEVDQLLYDREKDDYSWHHVIDTQTWEKVKVYYND